MCRLRSETDTTPSAYLNLVEKEALTGGLHKDRSPSPKVWRRCKICKICQVCQVCKTLPGLNDRDIAPPLHILRFIWI